MLFNLGKHHDQVLATNRVLQPRNLWRLHNCRAGTERIIRDRKEDYSVGKISSRLFVANETYFHLRLLPYNLVTWFQPLGLPEDCRPPR